MQRIYRGLLVLNLWLAGHNAVLAWGMSAARTGDTIQTQESLQELAPLPTSGEEEEVEEWDERPGRASGSELTSLWS